jgi:hypothetical protein
MLSYGEHIPCNFLFMVLIISHLIFSLIKAAGGGCDADDLLRAWKIKNADAHCTLCERMRIEVVI